MKKFYKILNNVYTGLAISFLVTELSTQKYFDCMMTIWGFILLILLFCLIRDTDKYV